MVLKRCQSFVKGEVVLCVSLVLAVLTAFAVPPEMAPHITRMEVILGQATRPAPHCASISYGNVMEVTFAGTGVSSETERRFFTHLVKEGIPVRVESNRTD